MGTFSRTLVLELVLGVSWATCSISFMSMRSFSSVSSYFDFFLGFGARVLRSPIVLGSKRDLFSFPLPHGASYDAWNATNHLHFAGFTLFWCRRSLVGSKKPCTKKENRVKLYWKPPKRAKQPGLDKILCFFKKIQKRKKKKDSEWFFCLLLKNPLPEWFFYCLRKHHVFSVVFCESEKNTKTKGKVFFFCLFVAQELRVGEGGGGGCVLALM